MLKRYGILKIYTNIVKKESSNSILKFMLYANGLVAGWHSLHSHNGEILDS